MGLYSPSESSSESTSSETPFAPEYINKSGDQVGDLINSAKTSASDQKARLADYINHLYQLREYAKMAAKGSASRGANGMQNPMSVFQSVNDMANQAGIPMDAEIGKALQSGNDIEKTLNSFLDSASKVYATLGSIPNRQSKSNSIQSGGMNSDKGAGGGSRIDGGGRKGAGGGAGGQGTFTDIYGDQHAYAGGPVTHRNSDVYSPGNFINGSGRSAPSSQWTDYLDRMSGRGAQPNGNAGGNAGAGWNMMNGVSDQSGFNMMGGVPGASFGGDSYTGGFNWDGLPGLNSFGVDPSHEAFSMINGVDNSSFGGGGSSNFGDSSQRFIPSEDGQTLNLNGGWSPSDNFDFFNNYSPQSSNGSSGMMGPRDQEGYTAPVSFDGGDEHIYEDFA